MRIGNLRDWLHFVDGIAAKAEETLVKLGYPAEDLATLSLLHRDERHHLDYVTGKGDPDRERAAFDVLTLCRQMHAHTDQFAENPERAAAALAALSWRLHMVASALYGDEVRAAFLSVAQSGRGKRGADARWKGGESVDDIIRSLASEKDELGDYLQPSELWPELYSAMEQAGLDPVEADNKYIYGNRDLTYGAFRKRIQRLR